MDINLEPFKEPRGFIKLLQWLFAICAFATTVDYSGKYGFKVACKDNSSVTDVKAIAEYPFNMDHQSVTYNGTETPLKCEGTQFSANPAGGAQSEAVFFVFTGVISFIYATVMIAVYLFADQIYLSNKRAALVDFFITIILAVFWIAGASAWAHGVSIVGSSMKFEDWLKCDEKAFVCTGYYVASRSKLIISVLFGFIDFVLWAGNIWFLYKETAAILNGGGMGVPPPQSQSQSP